MGLSERLASSLCAGIGGAAGKVDVDDASFAWRPLFGTAAMLRAWRPTRLPNGATLLFHGHLDNAASLAAELGAAAVDAARLYALALDRWGDEADTKVIGEYCSILVDRDRRSVRLARSPLRAPPLVYHRTESLVAAASVPRAIFAAGVERRLNRDHFADAFYFNFSDEEACYFSGVERVPLGSIVTLAPDRPRRLKRFYDVLALPKVRFSSDADYLARAHELLSEGVAAALAGARRPGVALSGGLDSPQIAEKALRLLPPGQRLPAFTFVPETGWDGVAQVGRFGDDGPRVRSFAAMHPRLEPHFCDNAGIAHDHRWRHMIQAMDGAPSAMANMFGMHGVWAEAKAQGCDRLLLADFGNATFSSKGEWAFVEYFLTGRWGQLHAALRHHPFDQRSMIRRFVSLSLIPLLPHRMWRWLMRAVHPHHRPQIEMVSPLRRDFLESSGARDRAVAAGVNIGRYQPRSHRRANAIFAAHGDEEASEIRQAFEQIYGIEQRDPTAYRPWVEFCLGLPTDMFIRDGKSRWLAREMAKGIMPEEQRTSPLYGAWEADWHLRIGRKRQEWLGALARIEADPDLGTMIDVPRLRSALENFPTRTSTDFQVWMPLEMGVPRALLAAEFFQHVEGRNDR